jgi:hypothetical protein
MSIRSYKLSIAVLTCIAAFFAWRCWVLFGQGVTAAFIDHQCETTQDLCRNYSLAANRDVSQLALQLDFLKGYYESRSNILAGSQLERVVRRDYDQALTNLLDTLRRETKDDLGDDLRAWIQKYEH